MGSILIKGGRVLSPQDGLDGTLDVLIEGDSIQQIAPSIGRRARVDEVLDASGLIVAPGFVDLHCHLRVPGGEISETLETGLAAAVAGGFTSVCAMPNTQPVNDKPESTRALIERARDLGLARVFPIAAVSLGSQGEDLTDFRSLVNAGAVAFSDDGRPVKTAELMRRALEKASDLGLPIIDHCETPELSAGGVINRGPISERLGVKGIPNDSEDVCVQRDIEIAESTGGPLHVAHLSTAKAVEMVRAAKRRDARVTCEVTPHHFALTDEAVERWGTNAKMNPPLRSLADCQAVRAGIAGGAVDCLATDHAPHAPALKAKPLEEAPFGVLGFETALALAVTHLVIPGKISLARLVDLMSSAPARIIRKAVTPSLGRLMAGGIADITVFDPARGWTYHVSESRSKSRNSPFDGNKLRGKVIATIVAGRVAYQYGQERK